MRIGKDIKLKPLSEAESLRRTPMPPEWYVGATHEPVHQDIGTPRPVKANRIKRREGDLNP